MGMDIDAKLFYGIAYTDAESEDIGNHWNSVADTLRGHSAMPGEAFIDYHTNEDCPRWYVSVAGHDHMIYGGDFRKVETLEAPNGAAEKIKAFCEEHGFPFSEDRLGWYVATHWSC